MEATKLSPFSKHRKEKYVSWVKKYLKTYLSTIFFIDECRVTLDGPDSRPTNWVLDDTI